MIVAGVVILLLVVRAVVVTAVDETPDETAATTVITQPTTSTTQPATSTTQPTTSTTMAEAETNSEVLLAFEHFTDDPDDGSSIAVMPLDGSERPIDLTTPGLYRDWGVHPSPDGSTLLFKRDPIGHRGSLQEQIWLMDPDGSNQRRIFSKTAGDVQNNPNGFTDLGHHEFENSGETLVFAADTPSTRSFAIWLMDIDGTNQRQITSGDHFDADPSVCPDGRILFARRPGISSAHQEAWIMDPDGANQQQLTDDVGDDRTPKAEWDIFCSPDGNRIIMVRQTDLLGIFQWDNVMIDIDGTNRSTPALGTRGSLSYGVARWLNETRVVSTQRDGSLQHSIITYDVDDPAVKMVLLAADATNQYRDPSPYIGVWSG